MAIRTMLAALLVWFLLPAGTADAGGKLRTTSNTFAITGVSLITASVMSFGVAGDAAPARDDYEWYSTYETYETYGGARPGPDWRLFVNPLDNKVRKWMLLSGAGMIAASLLTGLLDSPVKAGVNRDGMQISYQVAF